MSKKYKCPHCPATFNESDISSLSVFTCGGCKKKVSIKKKEATVSNEDALDWIGDLPDPADTPEASVPPPKTKAPEPMRTFKQQLDAAPARNYSRHIRRGGGFLDIEFKTFASVSVATVLWILAIVAFVLGVGLVSLGSALSLYHGPGELPPMPDMSLTYSDFDSVTEYYDHLSDVRAYERVSEYSPMAAITAPFFAALAGAIWLLFVRLGLELFVVIFRIYEELRAANQKR